MSLVGGSVALGGAIVDAGRKALEGSIEEIIEQNKREALADPANAGKSAEQAVQERLSAILSTKGPDPSKTLGQELAATLGPVRGGAIAAAASGRPRAGRGAADARARDEQDDQLRQDRRDPARAATQAVHDMQARALDPKVSVAEKERMIASPDEAIDGIAQAYTADFVRIYDEIRGEARSWREIVASADEENQPMLIALVRGGGKMLEVEELEFAIRRKNVDAIKDVLRRQPTKAKIDELVAQYELANGGRQPEDGRCTARPAMPRSRRTPPRSTTARPSCTAATPRTLPSRWPARPRSAARRRPAGSPTTGSGRWTSPSSRPA